MVFVQLEERFTDVPYHRCRVGLNHLAFHAKSKKQVDEITKKIKEKQVTVLYEDKYPNAGGSKHYGVYFDVQTG